MLDLTGNAWQREAGRLAQWTLERLVNRTDVYGSYLPLGIRQPGKSNNYTAPSKALRAPGALTTEIIEDHYRGYDQGSLIGLHAISPDCTCRWFVVDIDQHGDGDHAAIAAANAKAAFAWLAELQQRGFHPLLLDSNGHGGYHLLVVLAEPVSSQRVHAFATNFVQDYAARGLTQAPEVFPKQPDVNEQRRYGNWWRLPGRHHTREHWTKVWDGSHWLEDQAAVEAILSVTGDSPELIPVVCNRRVGVGPRGHNTCRPTAQMIGWRSSRAQDRAIGTTVCCALQASCWANGCRQHWSKSCASSGTKPETTHRARKSTFARRCGTLCNGTWRP